MMDKGNQKNKNLKKWEEAEIRIVKFDFNDVVMASGGCSCGNSVQTSPYYGNYTEQ